MKKNLKTFSPMGQGDKKLDRWSEMRDSHGIIYLSVRNGCVAESDAHLDRFNALLSCSRAYIVFKEKSELVLLCLYSLHSM